MGKRKNKFIQLLIKLIDEKTGGKVYGNPNTIKSMKEGYFNPTDRTIANMLKNNNMTAVLSITYNGVTEVIDFTGTCNDK